MGIIVYDQTSHPSSIKTWHPIGLLLIHLKWPWVHYFKAFVLHRKWSLEEGLCYEEQFKINSKPFEDWSWYLLTHFCTHINSKLTSPSSIWKQLTKQTRLVYLSAYKDLITLGVVVVVVIIMLLINLLLVSYGKRHKKCQPQPQSSLTPTCLVNHPWGGCSCWRGIMREFPGQSPRRKSRQPLEHYNLDPTRTIIISLSPKPMT